MKTVLVLPVAWTTGVKSFRTDRFMAQAVLRLVVFKADDRWSYWCYSAPDLVDKVPVWTAVAWLAGALAGEGPR